MGPTVPRWVISLLRAVRGVEEEVKGEALARARREVRREKLKSIVNVVGSKRVGVRDRDEERW